MCGHLLYGDFQKTNEQSLSNLDTTLNEHWTKGFSQELPGLPQIPGKAYQNPVTQRVGWSMPGGDAGGSQPQTIGTLKELSATDSYQRQSLQLCIETGKYGIEMANIDWTVPFSDGTLFEQIRRSYVETRPSILPFFFKFRKPKEAIFVRVSIFLGP